MWGWLTRPFRHKPKDGGAADHERLLEAERQAQELRLEVRAAERLAESLRNDLERARQAESTGVSSALEGRTEQLLTQASTPAAQLMAQAHLLEDEGRPVEARDVLAVAKRLVSALTEVGLVFEGAAGEAAVYDPNRHEPLGGSAPRVGQRIVIRLPGCSFNGRLLKRAGVEALPEEAR